MSMCTHARILFIISEKHLSLGENMMELQGMICGVGCDGVQCCLDCYTVDISVATLLYIQSSLFQHYSLFQNLFTEEQKEEVVTINVSRRERSRETSVGVGG